MTVRMIKILRKEISGIYATWHACGLRKAERGMPKGTLCDACRESVEAHILSIAEAEVSRAR